MKQSSKRMMSLLFAAALFFGTFYVYAYFIKPVYDDVSRTRAEVASSQNFIDTQKPLLTRINTAITNLENNPAQDSVGMALPLAGQEGSAVRDITALAAVNQLAVDSVTAGTPTVQNTKDQPQDSLVKPLGSVIFQVKLTGSYMSFKNFIKALETDIRIMDIKNVSVETPSRPQDLNTYTLTVAAYYQSQ